ncbi:Asp-tRNA(Asn)/Glu-tRNA(Gln) amidotransferase subunit GatB [Vulgatibacter incomptus]|uniref:Aspartyl/glutamyl-tRNA(Asn/Gln) amidotransferase subunit B n=1 Tax=Vulgatibacter incomptus TaxID=1391653 RepID=A0A0K1PIE8_9BACT|nr:Asp-tRNA(Asn)/Glu-tRNA(Gln) amidotransferase subunit GatB [Vulgatibacter incomptus]AKU93318.1 Aspartyl-tRNA(Asn) amidotransferase subunit B [Vulgatibacter incomptus]
MARSDWEVIIGLEVHAQLLTASKIFCSCSTAFGAEPNSQTCPVCLGMPGALPALNGKAVELAIRAGLGTGCEIRRESVFARKNYYYPDLPKGYQISQYDRPLCEHGTLTIDTPEGEKVVGITRIHMEEDAGKNTHDPEGGPSRVDLNRAGVPLIEIVGEPDLRSSDEAVEYLKGLRDIVVYLGVNDGNLEEGSFRCDANVSVRTVGETALRNRVELKNINSFRYVKQAIEYEVDRQIDVWEEGGKVVTETRLFDPQKGVTRSMRTKEEAQDYRYFPEPDLLPLRVGDEWIESIRGSLPELPREKAARFHSEYGLSAYDAGVLVAEKAIAEWYEAAVAAFGGSAKTVANWVINEILRLVKDSREGIAGSRLTPAKLAALLDLLEARKVSGAGAKQILEEVHRSGAEPAEVMAAKGLEQVSDTGAVDAAVEKVLAANADQVAKYQGGKKNLLGFFMGQVMKELKGQGDPKVVTDALRARLGD